MGAVSVQTCVDSVVWPGKCCACHEAVARVAVLDCDLTEHAMCQPCVDREPPSWVEAVKPLKWNPIWGPEPEARA